MYTSESGVEEQRNSVLPLPSAGSLWSNITWRHFIGLKSALAEDGQRSGVRCHHSDVTQMSTYALNINLSFSFCVSGYMGIFVYFY